TPRPVEREHSLAQPSESFFPFHRRRCLSQLPPLRSYLLSISDVGIRGLLPRTYLFRQSQILFCRPRLYLFLHCCRAGCWSLFRGLYPSRAGGDHRPVSDVAAGSGTQTTFRQPAHGAGHVIPPQRPRSCFRQWRGELRRFSDSLGYIRQYLGFDTIPPTRLCGGDLRHFGSISADTSAPGPTTCPLRLLGWPCLRRPRSHVWAVIERWRFWLRRGHARRNLRSGGLWSYQKVGRRLPGDSAPQPDLDRVGFHRSDRGLWCSMEPREDSHVCGDSAVHRVRLGLAVPLRFSAYGEARCHPRSFVQLAARGQSFLSSRCVQSAWKACAYFVHIPFNPPIPEIYLRVCELFHFPARTSPPASGLICRLILGGIHCIQTAQFHAARTTRHCRSAVVGGCEYILWHWSCGSRPMGSLALGNWGASRPAHGIRHRLGRGRSCRARLAHSISPGPTRTCGIPLFGPLGQFWGCCGHEQGALQEPRDEQNPQTDLCAPGKCTSSGQVRARREQGQRIRCPLTGRRCGFPRGLPIRDIADLPVATTSPRQQTRPIVMPAAAAPVADTIG
ncbi:hypothetical protein C8R46DRAFT_1273019, partial [Mycena filopes]